MIRLCVIFVLLFFDACTASKTNVFEDKRLMNEDMVKFCLIGDLGRETDLQQEIADSLDAEKCHRIFFLGDLVYPKGIDSISDPELQNKFLKYYEPLLNNNPELIINLILGNHDHKKDPSAWKSIDKIHEGFFFPNYYYFIDYGGLCFTALDTSFYYYTQKVNEMSLQTVWLMQLNPRIKDCKVNVALSHHPLKGDDLPGSKDWNGAKGPLKGFLETYIIGKFDLHITGHVHILHDDGKDEGTRLLISGTGGEVLGGGKPGYIVLTWEPHNPKKIGYHLKQIDTVPSVEDETMLQAQEEKEEPEWIIRKDRVEPPLLKRIWNKIRNLL